MHNTCLQEDANAAKSSLRVLVNVGKAEVELLRGTQEGSSDSNSLARFMIGGLWVSYRMSYAGKSLRNELLRLYVSDLVLRQDRPHMATTPAFCFGLTCNGYPVLAAVWQTVIQPRIQPMVTIMTPKLEKPFSLVQPR